MAQDKAKIARLVWGLLFVAMSLVVAILLILQVCDIYFGGGESPYTVETIGAHFDKISPSIYIWLVMIVGGFLLWEILPPKKSLGKNSIFYTYANVKKKLDGKQIEDCDTSKQFEKWQIAVIVAKIVCGVATGICIVFSLAYLCDGANFKNVDQNGEVAKAVLYLLPFVVVSFALLIGTVVFEWFVIKKQLPLAKQLIKDAKEDKIAKKPLEAFVEKLRAICESKNTILTLRIAVLVLGVVLLVYGAATGGSAGVLAKAITICRQCIGLG